MTLYSQQLLSRTARCATAQVGVGKRMCRQSQIASVCVDHQALPRMDPLLRRAGLKRPAVAPPCPTTSASAMQARQGRGVLYAQVSARSCEVISWRAGQVRTASIDGSQYSSSIPPPTPPLTSRRRPATLTVLRMLPTTRRRGESGLFCQNENRVTYLSAQSSSMPVRSVTSARISWRSAVVISFGTAPSTTT